MDTEERGWTRIRGSREALSERVLHSLAPQRGERVRGRVSGRAGEGSAMAVNLKQTGSCDAPHPARGYRPLADLSPLRGAR
jgi:hypothetical protein